MTNVVLYCFALCVIFCFSFYVRQHNASHVLAMAWASVCPSLAPCSPIKMVQDRITKSSPWAAPKTLVFVTKI